jgi:hypothetical protein
MRYATCAVSTSKGIDFLSFHRMNVCCSSGLLDGISAVKNAMRAVLSGTTTAISDPLNLTSDKSACTRGRASLTSFPVDNSAANLSEILFRREFTPAMITCLVVSSHDHSGT